MDTTLTLKDIVLFILVPLLGYMCYALYSIKGTTAGFHEWAKGHEILDNERHKDIKAELIAIQARIK